MPDEMSNDQSSNANDNFTGQNLTETSNLNVAQENQENTTPDLTPPELASEQRGPLEPAPASSPQPIGSNIPSSQPAPKKKKTGLIVGVVLAALVLLLGGAGSAYAFWYQNPDRVITDGISNAISAKNLIATAGANVIVKTEGVEVEIDISSYTNNKNQSAGKVSAKVKGEVEGLKIDADVNADIVSDVDDKNNTVYFKLNNLKESADKVFNATVAQQEKTYSDEGYSQSEIDLQTSFIKDVYESQIKVAIDKIDGKWLKYSFDKNNSESTTCYFEALQKMQDDKSQSKEIANLYRKHKFIDVKEKLGSKDGSLGYLLEFNETKSKEFAKGLKDTTVYKSLNDCEDGAGDELVEGLREPFDSEGTPELKRVELWVDRWSHKVTGVVVELDGGADRPGSSNNKVNIIGKLNIDYKKTQEINIPTDATDIEEFAEDLFGPTSNEVDPALISL